MVWKTLRLTTQKAAGSMEYIVAMAAVVVLSLTFAQFGSAVLRGGLSTAASDFQREDSLAVVIGDVPVPVDDSLRLDPGVVPAALTEEAYAFSFADFARVPQGTDPASVSWRIETQEPLPAGFSFNAQTGVLSGMFAGGPPVEINIAVFVRAGGDKQREYAVRRLHKVAAEMRARGQHGLWLLWAERGSPEHRHLRSQLGRGLGWWRAEPGAAEVGEEEFIILRMRSGRVAATYVMPAPFSYAAVGEFAAAFARDELRPEGWQAELARWAPLWLPLLAALCLLRTARRKAPSPAAAGTPSMEARPSVAAVEGKAAAAAAAHVKSE